MTEAYIDSHLRYTWFIAEAVGLQLTDKSCYSSVVIQSRGPSVVRPGWRNFPVGKELGKIGLMLTSQGSAVTLSVPRFCRSLAAGEAWGSFAQW